MGRCRPFPSMGVAVLLGAHSALSLFVASPTSRLTKGWSGAPVDPRGLNVHCSYLKKASTSIIGPNLLEPRHEMLHKMCADGASQNKRSVGYAKGAARQAMREMSSKESNPKEHAVSYAKGAARRSKLGTSSSSDVSVALEEDVPPADASVSWEKDVPPEILALAKKVVFGENQEVEEAPAVVSTEEIQEEAFKVEPVPVKPVVAAEEQKEVATALKVMGNEIGTRAMELLSSVYKFARPHTIRGTILASITGVLRVLLEVKTFTMSAGLVVRAGMGLLALLLGNAYIVGINQIYDVEIDKINKPLLPIASGEMSKRTAWTLVASSATLGPIIVLSTFSPLIFWLYTLGLVSGGLYSVPPVQLKRFPILAGLSIAGVRGFLLNFGVYHAVKDALGVPFRWNPAVLFLSRFMTVFAGIIAVTKDLSDVKGDKENNIETFASSLGVAFTAKAASIVLALNYASAIAQGVLSPAGAFNRKVMIGGHAALLAGLGIMFRKLDPESHPSIQTFYKRIWDLFYLEYALYPFI